MERPGPEARGERAADPGRPARGEQEGRQRRQADRHGRGQRAHAEVVAQRRSSVVSTVRYVAARNAQSASEKRPTASGNGASQARRSRSSPGRPARGCVPRPARPRSSRAAPARWCSRSRRRRPQRCCAPSTVSSARNANAEPRSTTPTRNSVSGTCSATEIAANAGGKRREEHDDDEDQPDVVRLPDRADGVLDERALLRLARAGRQQIPDAAAEVGAAEQGVEHERDARSRPPRGSSGGMRGARRVGRVGWSARRDLRGEQVDDRRRPGRDRRA